MQVAVNLVFSSVCGVLAAFFYLNRKTQVRKEKFVIFYISVDRQRRGAFGLQRLILL